MDRQLNRVSERLIFPATKYPSLAKGDSLGEVFRRSRLSRPSQSEWSESVVMETGEAAKAMRDEDDDQFFEELKSVICPSSSEEEGKLIEDYEEQERNEVAYEHKSPLFSIIQLFAISTTIVLLSILLMWTFVRSSSHRSYLTAQSYPLPGPIDTSNLRLKFPKQTDRTWRTLESAIRLLRTGEHKTAVILVAGLDKSTNHRFARAVSDDLTDFQRMDNIVDISNMNSPSKLMIDQALQRVVLKSIVAVLTSVDHLQDPVLLYRYCDPYTPLFQNRIYLIVLDLPSIDYSGLHFKSKNEQQLMVEEFLSLKWIKTDKDEELIYPLFARIANSLVVVHPE
ncbi:hypothetical protein ACOME3_003009 [Neoechinorhynchus agilis]